MNKYTIAEIKELMSMGFTPAQIAQMCAEPAPAPARGKTGTGKKAPQPKAEKVEFVKSNGEKVMVTPAQAAAWSKWREHSSGKTLDEVKAEYAAKREAFVPSDALIQALKAKPTMTRKEAAALGFVGTKDELKALKVAHNVYAK